MNFISIIKWMGQVFHLVAECWQIYMDSSKTETEKKDDKKMPMDNLKNRNQKHLAYVNGGECTEKKSSLDTIPLKIV